MAGLKIFWPRPPKDILTTPIENTAPTAMSHHGEFGGRFNAKSTPVTAADKSETVLLRFIRNFVISHSVKTQASTPTSASIITDIPKNHTETRNAGAIAMSTSLIIFRVESAECMCGDGETINFFI